MCSLCKASLSMKCWYRSGSSLEESSSAIEDSDGPDQAKAWQDKSAALSGSQGARLAVWPADSALSSWRAASRECHLYAYAPPTR